MTEMRYIGEVPPPPPKTPWRRRFILAGALVLLAVFSTYLGIEFHADWELRQALAEADQLDPGWRLEELEARRALVPASENGAPLVLTAHAAIPENWPCSDIDSVDTTLELRLEINRLLPQHQCPPELLEFLGDAVAQAEAAVIEARKLVDFPRGRHAVDWTQGRLATVKHGSEFTRKIADVLSWDIRLQLQHEEIEAALRSLLAQLNLFRMLGDEPALYSVLVRISGQSIVVNNLERILAQGEATALQLEHLQLQLVDESAGNMLLLAARSERAGYHELFQGWEAGVDVDTDLECMSLLSDKRPLPLTKLSWHLPFVRKRQRTTLLRLHNRLVEIAKLPEEQQPPALQDWERQFPSERNLALAMSQGLAYLPQACQRAQARLRTANAALAVERYRLDRGSWPDSLDVLCPCYLVSVPIDPFDFHPLRYRRLRDGVVVYSCGQDGEDNGGVLFRRGFPNDPGYDLGFQLWNVEQRRQPPLPPEPPPELELP